ncbi:MAG: TIGR03086 family metal-binding protein [Acidimicrobiia bacterium]
MEALSRADAQFARVIGEVTVDDLDRPTPCEGWDVRALLNHVVGGNRMSVVALEGGSRDDVLAVFGDDLLADDYLVAYQDSAADQLAAFEEDGALAGMVHHPIGEVPAAQLLQFRIGDLTLHSWDLARAIGADETVDPALAAYVLAALLPMGDHIKEVGVFGEGPSGTVPDDAPDQQRLLDLAGRRS